MMANLNKVYEITLELKQLLVDKPVSSKERETVIEKLNELIEDRGKWMEQLSPPYTEEEKQLGEQIYQMNIGVQENMERIFADLKLEMKQVQKQKKTQQSYSNPYKHVSFSDGTFLDRKK